MNDTVSNYHHRISRCAREHPTNISVKYNLVKWSFVLQCSWGFLRYHFFSPQDLDPVLPLVSWKAVKAGATSGFRRFMAARMASLSLSWPSKQVTSPLASLLPCQAAKMVFWMAGLMHKAWGRCVCTSGGVAKRLWPNDFVFLRSLTIL